MRHYRFNISSRRISLITKRNIMYSLENKNYGIKLTLNEPLTSESMVRLRNELKAHLLHNSSNGAQGVVVDMRSPSATNESMSRMMYAL
jgi:hypothetical protein